MPTTPLLGRLVWGRVRPSPPHHCTTAQWCGGGAPRLVAPRVTGVTCDRCHVSLVTGRVTITIVTSIKTCLVCPTEEPGGVLGDAGGTITMGRLVTTSRKECWLGKCAHVLMLASSCSN